MLLLPLGGLRFVADSKRGRIVRKCRFARRASRLRHFPTKLGVPDRRIELSVMRGSSINET